MKVTETTKIIRRSFTSKVFVFLIKLFQNSPKRVFFNIFYLLFSSSLSCLELKLQPSGLSLGLKGNLSCNLSLVSYQITLGKLSFLGKLPGNFDWNHGFVKLIFIFQNSKNSFQNLIFELFSQNHHENHYKWEPRTSKSLADYVNFIFYI